MAAARYAAGAASLPNGKVLIAGGLDGNTPGGLSSTEIYDPATMTFSAGPSMNEAPGPCTAILLPNGKVFINGSGLIVNGPASNDVSVAEVFDPSNNSITEISLNRMRQFAASVLLPNGKVLVAGGAGIGMVLSSTRIYDPSLNSFSDGPSMPAASFLATPSATSDGKVLFIGGVNVSVGLDSVEIYNTETNSFTAGAPLTAPRFSPTATLLPNGYVLITGGLTGTTYLTSTQLYAQ